MVDYYAILKLSREANPDQVKAAFKRLAMLYHPDRNPGSKEAEEMFKEINEAYHILSDPLKKTRYDSKLKSTYSTPQDTTENYWREIQKKQYYNFTLRQKKQYRFDKNYFKIQGLAFLTFIVISGFCFGVVHTSYYFIRKRQAKIWYTNSQLLKQIDTLFLSGKYQQALIMIDTLEQKNPLEFRFNFRRDSLVGELRKLADIEFNSKNYLSANDHFTLLKDYEAPARLETLNRLASCEYFLGHYSESLQALKHLHNQQPANLELVYQIGILNFEKLNNNEEALYYFTLGKKLFKQNLTEVYGKAFYMVMNASDAPDVYFDIFEARSKVNIELKNYKEAITDCNWAIYLRPQKGEPYRLRALAKVKSYQDADICEDLAKARQRGARSIAELERKYCR